MFLNAAELKLSVSSAAFCLVPTEDANTLVVCGGYSKQRVKKDDERGVTHTDMFALQRRDDEWEWLPVEQSGSKPTPRCGCTAVATPGNRALIFGGVFDKVLIRSES